MKFYDKKKGYLVYHTIRRGNELLLEIPHYTLDKFLTEMLFERDLIIKHQIEEKGK